MTIPKQLLNAKICNRDTCAEVEQLTSLVNSCQEEIRRLNNDIKILLKENEAKEKVIIKQDNALNELEKWVYQFREEHKNDTGIFDKFLTTREVLDKLKELKESDK